MEIKYIGITADEITDKLTRGAEGKVREGYLIGKIVGDEVIVNDVYVPLQKSSDILTFVKPADRDKAYEEIKKKGYEVISTIKYKPEGTDLSVGMELSDLVTKALGDQKKAGADLLAKPFYKDGAIEKTKDSLKRTKSLLDKFREEMQKQADDADKK